MNDLPEPFVPADCDCRTLDSMPFNVERLMASELVAVGSHVEVMAAIFLWCRAWKQMPAASLPDDDAVLAAFARLPIAKFRKMRERVLHGFVKCSDGRLYHRFLAEVAIEASQRRAAFVGKREREAQRIAEWRRKRQTNANGTPTETQTEREPYALQNEDVTGTERVLSVSVSLNPPKPPQTETVTAQPRRGTRLAPDWQPSEAAAAYARNLGLDPVKLAERFRNYWHAKAGKDAAKLDWDATWRNWCLTEAERNPPARKPTPSGYVPSPVSGAL